MIDNDTCFNMIGNTPVALVFFYLLHIADDDGCVVKSYTEMSGELKIPRATLHKYIQQLVGIGMVRTGCEQSVNEIRTKKVLIYIAQISDYKSVTKTCKNKCEQNVNKMRITREQKESKSKKVKRTLDERKKDFVEQLKPYIEKYGKDMLNDFYRYWAQVNDNGTKMLWEKQKCFEISKRLATWKRNEEERKRPQRTEIGVVLEKVKNKFDNEEEF